MQCIDARTMVGAHLPENLSPVIASLISTSDCQTNFIIPANTFFRFFVPVVLYCTETQQLRSAEAFTTVFISG